MEESQRQRKISSVLQKDLAQVLNRLLKDSGANNLIVSVTKVSVTVDLSVAKVYVSVFPADKGAQVVSELSALKPSIKHQIALLTKNQLRKMPDLSFFNDDSLEYIGQIEQAVKGGQNPITDPSLLERRKKELMGRLPYFIAKRYLLAKHSRHAVGLLSKIAIGAVAVATFSLFLVLSGFTGLKDYALAFTNIFDSDLIVTPVSGKSFIYEGSQQKALQGLTEIEAVGRVVQDKVFLRYKNQARVATLRGIDSAYTHVTPVDTLVYTGNWFNSERPEVVPGYSVAADLALAARDFSNLIQISAPIPGANIMAATSPDQVFRSEQVVASGIYEVNDQVNDRFVFSSIQTARYLFGWDNNQVSSLVLKTSSQDLEALKAQISSVFDGAVTVKTRVEQNAALYRMLNSENLFTYLFISLIAAIAVFNLTGTLIMLVLEKKNNLRTLFTLGQPLGDIKRTFFTTGLLMCGIGLALGLLLGVLVVLGQSSFGWVLITETLPYPVTLTWGNFLLVAATILGLGMLASFLGAQRVTRRLLD